MNYLIIHLITGIIGYFLTIEAFKRIKGYKDMNIYKQQLPIIILGPIAIVCGVLLLWDIYIDPPKNNP